MKKYISIGIVVTIMLLVAALSISLNVIKRKNIHIYELENRKPEIKIEHTRDTIRDTIRIPKPYPVKEIVIEKVPVPVGVDSIEITRKTYKDSLYRAVVSGYKVSLDTINIYSNIIKDTIIIEKTNYIRGEKHGLWIGIGKKGVREKYIGIGYILQ